MERLRALLLGFALVAALATVVVLIVQSRDHRERYAQLYERAAYPHTGGFVPSFATHTLDSVPVTIGERQESGTQTLFVFNTACPYCKASVPAWNAIAAALDTTAVPGAVFGISLDSAHLTRAYDEAHDLAFPVVHFPQRKLVALYRTRTVPLTMVLDQEGRILVAHIGVVAGDSLVESIVKAARSAIRPEPRSAIVAAEQS
jgi:peroxiredoxin